jgi:predicted GH43/DUF377 family glycosyl hydrolase
MFYSYRDRERTLPGIRLATSRDGKQSTKVRGPDLLTAAPEQRYIEWHQITKIGNRYVLVHEGYNGSTRWCAGAATSTTLTAGWKKAPADLFDQTKWPHYSDRTMFHVAAPAIYRIGGRWYMYFSAAPAGYYIVQHRALWCIGCDEAVARLKRGA